MTSKNPYEAPSEGVVINRPHHKGVRPKLLMLFAIMAIHMPQGVVALELLFDCDVHLGVGIVAIVSVGTLWLLCLLCPVRVPFRLLLCVAAVPMFIVIQLIWAIVLFAATGFSEDMF